MRTYFSDADEKFVQLKKVQVVKESPLSHYKFRLEKSFKPTEDFDHYSVPLDFKVSPDSLLTLCIKVVDALPLPTVYEWTNVDVCQWIRKYGYPQYMNTFRANFITGRKLLLLDAQSLSAMNIKNFEEIKRIAYGIRQLFFYEMTKYMRSISLPPEYYYELYKMFQVKSGDKYRNVPRADLWRRMQLLRAKRQPQSHWHRLERWLALERDQTELFGGVQHYPLYKCKAAPPPKPTKVVQIKPCHCCPPCSCYWTEKQLNAPLVFTQLKPDRETDQIISKERCKKCKLACTCHWPSRFYKFEMLLTSLKTSFPAKYGRKRDELLKRTTSRFGMANYSSFIRI
ncbi:uncharacterized protein LOC128860277 [Anastrepha ludens]|uniref:uncharacterized protein LOC128860277 n=1 Tax=Anastrepha ludens TaxID=28586 RepID=UPI0023AFCB8E|nr:uncharacterized protein LOC128860277 [Anastrepha ludens]